MSLLAEFTVCSPPETGRRPAPGIFSVACGELQRSAVLSLGTSPLMLPSSRHSAHHAKAQGCMLTWSLGSLTADKCLFSLTSLTTSYICLVVRLLICTANIVIQASALLEKPASWMVSLNNS